MMAARYALRLRALYIFVCVQVTASSLDSFPTTAAPERFCGRFHFACDNGKCVAETDECDGTDDCGDNSDEHCGTYSTYSQYSFQPTLYI